MREIAGAIAGSFQGTKDMRKRLQKLEGRDRASRVERLIAKGRASKQITPGNEKAVRAAAAKHGTGYLRAFLETAPPAVEVELREPTDLDDAPTAADKPLKITAQQRKIWAKQGMTEEMMQKAARELAKRERFVARVTGKGEDK